MRREWEGRLAAMAGAELRWSWKPGVPSLSLTWVQGPQDSGHPLTTTDDCWGLYVQGVKWLLTSHHGRSIKLLIQLPHLLCNIPQRPTFSPPGSMDSHLKQTKNSCLQQRWGSGKGGQAAGLLNGLPLLPNPLRSTQTHSFEVSWWLWTKRIW